jgi:ABC-type transporter Mla subunit MlaD
MALEGVKGWLDVATDWRRRVTTELTALPQTLAQLREGVDNFQRVTRRLVDATESIEQFNQMQNSAVKTLRDQIAAAPGSTMVVGAFDELSDALGTLARLNPFWPRVAPKETPRDDG